MSQKTVDTGKRGYELYAAGDLQGVAALFSQDAEVADGGGLGLKGAAVGTLHGPEGCLRSASESVDALADYHLEIDDYIDAGEAVIVLVRISATGRASGAQLEARLAHLWAIGGDGKVIRGEVYRSAEEALDAVVPVGQPRPVSLAFPDPTS